MVKRVIHYQHPKHGSIYHACGIGIPNTDRVTSDINAVTCKQCLNTTTGKKRSNRQVGDRPKTSKTFRVDTDLAEAIEARSQNTGESQVQILEAALRAYLGIAA